MYILLCWSVSGGSATQTAVDQAVRATVPAGRVTCDLTDTVLIFRARANNELIDYGNALTALGNVVTQFPNLRFALQLTDDDILDGAGFDPTLAGSITS